MSGSPQVDPAVRPSPLRVAVIGNPNTGKTTLFNALTGLRQRVGNFAGVTVERVEGTCRAPNGQPLVLLDLPGSYSLSATSPDERIALDVLLGRDRDHWHPDVVLLVVDAAHLERNLFLLSQVLELGIPVAIALNQIDVAEREGLRIDIPALIHVLGVPVVPTVAKRGEGIDPLLRAVCTAATLPAPVAPAGLPTLTGADPSRADAEARYAWIADVLRQTVTRQPARAAVLSDRIDAIALHRVWGPFVFLLMMALVFQAVFTGATPLMDGLQAIIDAIGVQVTRVVPPGDLQSLLVQGVVQGVGAVVVFLPQIAILFAFIGLLEHSGYMARAAYLMESVMRRVGLHGKSFIPMLSGYACAVPGIMATRTIEDPKDRLATMMVVPLMSCSARLPVYTLLIGAFVPATHVGLGLTLQGATMLAMYLLGTVTALLVAAVFRRTLLRGKVRPMILELPPYRWPSLASLGVSVAQRCQVFLRRAGTIILALSIVLWALATYPKAPVDPALSPSAQQEQQLAHSVLGRMGRAIEPAVRPLGYDWKIAVALVSSFAAREVFVSTMSTLYDVGSAPSGDQVLESRLREAKDPVTGTPVYSPLMAVGLMVFYVFALMCMSTITVTVREAGGGRVGWGWAALQFTYMLALAYGAAWIVYAGGRALGYGG